MKLPTLHKIYVNFVLQILNRRVVKLIFYDFLTVIRDILLPWLLLLLFTTNINLKPAKCTIALATP